MLPIITHHGFGGWQKELGLQTVPDLFSVGVYTARDT